MIHSRFLFYAASFTWGIIMTLIGCVVAVILIIAGHRPKKYGYCWCFEVGNGWGGVSLGPFFIVKKNASEHTKSHEHGHSIQSCYLGPLMPFVVSMPSAIRYWYRNLRRKINKPCKTGYYDIWFEKDASLTGKEFMAWYNTK